MKPKIKIAASFGIIGLVLLLSGCSVFKSNDATYNIDLEIWGPIDDSSVLDEAVKEYRKINPYVGSITYRKMTYDNYKRDVVDALASGQGPDIFLIDNNWLPYFQNKIEPAPDYLLNEVDVRNSFVDVVGKDFIRDGQVYAMPLSVDSLALYCNKDLFNAAGITSFPATWEEMQEDAKLMSKLSDTGEFTQSGAALGAAKNINRASDIVYLMMLQKGAEMTDKDGKKAQFHQPIYSQNVASKPGEDALAFFTQFADSGSPYYSWNSRMHYSVDAFSEGNLAMMVNYSWQADAIRNKNSKLNFTVVPIPQFKGRSPLSFAYYMGYAVTKNKMRPQTESVAQGNSAEYNRVRIHESWEFIKFLTMRNGGKMTLVNGLTGNSKDFPVAIDPADIYLKATGRPAARKDLVEKQKTDPELSPFAYGNLIATSWHQVDPQSISLIFEDSIDQINRGSATVFRALEVASQRVNQLMGGK